MFNKITYLLTYLPYKAETQPDSEVFDLVNQPTVVRSQTNVTD